jgi:hypothetical protein
MPERFLKKDRDDKDIEDFINRELDFIKVSLITAYSTPIKARVYLFLAFKEEESNEENKQIDTESKNRESLKDLEEGVAEESEKKWTFKNNEKLRPGYSEESNAITHYLITLKRLAYLSIKEFRQFKNKALTFIIYKEHLFKKINNNISLRRIMDFKKD